MASAQPTTLIFKIQLNKVQHIQSNSYVVFDLSMRLDYTNSRDAFQSKIILQFIPICWHPSYCATMEALIKTGKIPARPFKSTLYYVILPLGCTWLKGMNSCALKMSFLPLPYLPLCHQGPATQLPPHQQLFPSPVRTQVTFNLHRIHTKSISTCSS